jgi:hypothetical protein
VVADVHVVRGVSADDELAVSASVREGGPGSGVVRARLPELAALRRIDAAGVRALAQAATASPLESSSPCARFHERIADAAEVVEDARLGTTLSLLPREVVVDGCARLPHDVQSCLVPEYRREHEARCRDRLRRLGRSAAARGLADNSDQNQGDIASHEQ